MKNNEKIKDFKNNNIQINDKVIFIKKLSSSIRLGIGTVLDIKKMFGNMLAYINDDEWDNVDDLDIEMERYCSYKCKSQSIFKHKDIKYIKKENIIFNSKDKHSRGMISDFRNNYVYIGDKVIFIKKEGKSICLSSGTVLNIKNMFGNLLAYIEEDGYQLDDIDIYDNEMREYRSYKCTYKNIYKLGV